MRTVTKTPRYFSDIDVPRDFPMKNRVLPKVLAGERQPTKGRARRVIPILRKEKSKTRFYRESRRISLSCLPISLFPILFRDSGSGRKTRVHQKLETDSISPRRHGGIRGRVEKRNSLRNPPCVFTEAAEILRGNK